MSRRTECPDCLGSGLAPNRRDFCKRCGGIGQVPRHGAKTPQTAAR